MMKKEFTTPCVLLPLTVRVLFGIEGDNAFTGVTLRPTTARGAALLNSFNPMAAIGRRPHGPGR
ncbi:hypothetical protein [Azoarcus sp. DN11]|uniref:hypothetical protein n=1 Tax=Azoarcus sp. DN11 TaxID=356837 RepID=UPI000FE189EF|nr:hypothetical protein [Azoarcus sp. DN11]